MNQSLNFQTSHFNTIEIPGLPSDTAIFNEEHPHARFTRLGPQALSDAELISLFFKHVSTNGNPVEIARKLITQFGGISELGALNIERLSGESGMNTSSSIRLLAAFELASRCAEERMMRKSMNSAEAIYQAMAPRLAYKNSEYVLIVLLDGKLRALRTVELSKGNGRTALCEPRDVLHQVIINKALAFVLVHNHPSGDPGPSRQDLALTKKVQQASEFMNLRFVDHIIIGRPADDRQKSYYSFTEAGVL